MSLRKSRAQVVLYIRSLSCRIYQLSCCYGITLRSSKQNRGENFSYSSCALPDSTSAGTLSVDGRLRVFFQRLSISLLSLPASRRQYFTVSHRAKFY